VRERQAARHGDVRSLSLSLCLSDAWLQSMFLLTKDRPFTRLTDRVHRRTGPYRTDSDISTDSPYY